MLVRISWQVGWLKIGTGLRKWWSPYSWKYLRNVDLSLMTWFNDGIWLVRLMVGLVSNWWSSDVLVFMHTYVAVCMHKYLYANLFDCVCFVWGNIWRKWKKITAVLTYSTAIAIECISLRISSNICSNN